MSNSECLFTVMIMALVPVQHVTGETSTVTTAMFLAPPPWAAGFAGVD